MSSNHGISETGDFPFKLSQPALRALLNAGITNLEQVSQHSEAELKKLHGLGPKTIRQLREALALKGLTYSEK